MSLIHQSFQCIAGQDDQPTGNNSTYYIVIGVSSIVIIALLAGVIINVKRQKTVRGTTWFPEGFFKSGTATTTQRRSDRRKGPDGQEMR